MIAGDGGVWRHHSADHLRTNRRNAYHRLRRGVHPENDQRAHRDHVSTGASLSSRRPQRDSSNIECYLVGLSAVEIHPEDLAVRARGCLRGHEVRVHLRVLSGVLS